MSEDQQLVIDYLLTKIKDLVHENAVLNSRLRSQILSPAKPDDDSDTVIG